MMERTWRVLAGCERSGRNRDAFARTGKWDECWSCDLVPSDSPVGLTMFEGGSYVKVSGQDIPEEIVPGAAHYVGDVLDLFRWDHPVNARRKAEDEKFRRETGRSLPLWDLAVLNPPCTHLSGAGAVWWKKKRLPRQWPDGSPRPSVQDEAAMFFIACLYAPAAHVAVENPQGDMTRRGYPPDQYVQPWMFGDDLTKKTGIWLRNLPPLVADRELVPSGARVATGGGSWRTDQKHGRGANNGYEDGEGRRMREVVRSRTPLGLARAMAEQWTPYVTGAH